MNRKDYRKMMQRKKMSKIYSKSLILAVLGLGVSISGNTIVKAEQREWKANTSTTIKKGDTEYKILWGDTLSLISRDSGITIETLTQLNNILDANLIYEGNIIYFGNGATATVKDESGNVIAETPLTPADKEGIKEAQKNNTNSTNSTTTSNVNTGNSSNNVSSNTTNSSSANSNNGNNASNKPTNPTKPEKPSDKPLDKPLGKPSDKPSDGNEEDGSGTEIPQTKEYTVTINHLTEDGEVLSKEVVKAKENSTFEAKAKKFEGYELLSTDKQTVKVTEDKTITFIYKKVDNTKPEVEKVDVTIKYVGDDGKTLATETVTAEKGSTVKADAKDFTDLGYVLDDTLTKEVKATEGSVITFNYRKIVTPTPVEKFQITTKYVDVDGNSIADDKVQEVEKGTTVKEEAISINGYKLKGNSVQSVIVNSNETITFVYEKDAEYVPIHTEETITQVIDADTGVNLGTIVPSGYTVVSETTDGGKTTTASNGDTHTIYTKTITVKKDYVPQHTTEYVTVNVDTDGNVLSSTDGYEKVSESTDGGKVTTQPNGDTHTVYTTTVVWKKVVVTPPVSDGSVIVGEWNGVYYSGLGNSGKTFKTQNDADNYAMQTIAGGETSYTGWSTWEVRMAGTNEIRITVDFY
ncbi:LysM domain-containing protein [Vagococcus sp. CY53-2]|uniref:LysM peptidoglycan-binding domain-containing protein n=1 Tax=Vagococcus sp. CY53-2 TaxID=2925780 RepID=UPI001F507E94|nr:LysM domain-containing protein [Vagococcus sp. CY53-2]MCI0130037.1 MucBP domain-containing protein [Vagococcus sp. CY53-2]